MEPTQSYIPVNMPEFDNFFNKERMLILADMDVIIQRESFPEASVSSDQVAELQILDTLKRETKSVTKQTDLQKAALRERIRQKELNDAYDLLRTVLPKIQSNRKQITKLECLQLSYQLLKQRNEEVQTIATALSDSAEENATELKKAAQENANELSLSGIKLEPKTEAVVSKKIPSQLKYEDPMWDLVTPELQQTIEENPLFLMNYEWHSAPCDMRILDEFDTPTTYFDFQANHK